MMAAGFAVVLAWRALGWPDAIYEVMPGVLVPLVIYTIFSRFTSDDGASK